MESFLYYSPLEQFEIIPLFSLYFLIFTFRITNQLFVLLLVIAVLTLVVTLKATGYNPVASLVSSIPVISAVSAVAASVTEPVMLASALPVNT
jgi:hypothetical protein